MTHSFPTRRSSDLIDRLADIDRQRAGIANAGCAAITDEVEAHGVEIVLQARLREIVGHDLRAGGQRGFHPGFHLERSDEHTSELQSLMRISYAVFCLKKKNQSQSHTILNNY